MPLVIALRALAGSRPARRSASCAAAALTLVAVLGACTGGDSASEAQRPVASGSATTSTSATPASAPTPSTAPAPTPTRSTTAASSTGPADLAAIDLTVAPTLPAALERPPSEEAAEEVAEYFVRLYPYTVVTRDLAPFRDISYNDCGFCNRTIERLQGYDAKGVRSEGGAIVVHEAVAEELSNDYYIVRTTISEDASRDVAADGTVVREDPGAADVTYVVDVKWYDGEWFVMTLTNG